MDTPESDLMVALENFWNAFASARKDVVLIVCASATSWMLSKVVHNKGGLYNRLTAEDAPLKDEFKYLYASLFRHPDSYIKLISALGKKKAGMTREELIKASGIANTGNLSVKLEELESCRFNEKIS